MDGVKNALGWSDCRISESVISKVSIDESTWFWKTNIVQDTKDSF